MKSNRLFTKLAIAASLLVATAAFAGDDSPLSKEERTRLDSLAQKVKDVTSKAGITFGGKFQAQGFASTLSGDTLMDDGRKSREDILSTTLDLEMKARPLDALSATAILRMHQDWRNMFASSGTPLQTRWISMDGQIKKLFFYNAGDLKAKFSPFTLWAPEPNIMFEPQVFARERASVMEEVFAGDNNRVLQGVNLGFHASMMPVFDEFKLNVLGARIAHGGLEGEHGPFSQTNLDVAADNMDRYLLVSNLDFAVRPGIELGGTFLLNKSAVNTFDGSLHEAEVEMTENSVIAFRGGLGTDFVKAIDTEKFHLGLRGEFAMSGDRIDAEVAVDTIDDTIFDTTSVSFETLDGIALSMGGDMTVALGEMNRLNLDGTFLLVKKDFRNQAAQSPIFWRRDVMNTEAAADDMLYNPFDALYRHVFKFAPSAQAALDGGYVKQPINKIAWTRAIMNQETLNAATEVRFGNKASYQAMPIHGTMDTDISPVLPMGDATPNRMGIKAGGSANILDSAITLAGAVQMFNDAEEIRVKDTVEVGSLTADDITGEDSLLGTSAVLNKVLDKGKYTQLGGGLSMDIAQFGDWWKYPIVLSGSMKMSKITGKKAWINETTDDNGIVTAMAFETKDFQRDVTFLNAGLYGKFYKKAAVLFGMQQLKKKMDVTEQETTYTQWAAGAEFAVTEGGTVTATYGNINSAFKTENKDNSIDAKQLNLHLTVKF